MGPTMDDARRTLKEYFGYDDFRAPQRPAIEAVLSRRDAVIVLPTGGGKSICFQVPALLFPRMTIVVSPLISLMADQVQALERKGIAATYLNSTLPPDEAGERTRRIRDGQVRLLYLAPERLTVGGTARMLAEVGVDLLAIDEAHCVSEWGQDFRPSYLRLAPCVRPSATHRWSRSPRPRRRPSVVTWRASWHCANRSRWLAGSIDPT